MSIRLIAQDLYRVQKEVEKLELALDDAPAEKRADVEAKLRAAKREKAQLQGALDGKIGRTK